MTNKDIGKILKNTAAMIDLTGGNPYRSRAMANAARNIERAEETVVQLAEAGNLKSIRGIGDGLADQINEIIATGTFQAREDLIGAIPAGLMEILRIKGLGAKKVRTLWQKLGVTTIKELEEMATTGQLATVDGFAEKTQANVLANIQLLKKYVTRRRYADLYRLIETVPDMLKALPAVSDAAFAGEIRRKMETVGEVILVVASDDATVVGEALTPWLDAPATHDASANALSATVADGIPCRVLLVDTEAYGTALWEQTGNDNHVKAFMAQHGSPASGATENSIYEAAGLAFIPPELREGEGELEAAANKTLPALIIADELNGTLHNHSTYSDGAHTLQQMADRAYDMGLSYFGICDHSQSLVVAHGLAAERVAEQQEEIGRLNAQYVTEKERPFKIFSGIESDILNDGALDYTDDVLASFDFIVASVHTRLNMPEDEATARVLKAVENPYTSILGHPTGRILLVREGYSLDYDVILEACARNNVAIELNASPYRLDLDWRYIRKATQMGILISINPDAHAMDGLHDMHWGTEVARKGWLTTDQCLNAMPLADFETWLAAQKAKRPA
ncbi:MAG: PHP domain-containing protein [Bacteroidota bacterium]